MAGGINSRPPTTTPLQLRSLLLSVPLALDGLWGYRHVVITCQTKGQTDGQAGIYTCMYSIRRKEKIAEIKHPEPPFAVNKSRYEQRPTPPTQTEFPSALQPALYLQYETRNVFRTRQEKTERPCLKRVEGGNTPLAPVRLGGLNTRHKPLSSAPLTFQRS